jgi:hypothetical protein
MVRYGHMLKANLKKIRVRVRLGWYSEGSVMAGTITSRCSRADSHIEVDSEEDPALIAALIQNARGGCYAEAALSDPLLVVSTAALNGRDFDYHAYPKRPSRRRQRRQKAP